MEVIIALILAIATEVGIPPQFAQCVALQENPTLNPELIAGPNANGTYDYGIMGLNSKYIDSFVNDYWDKPWRFDWKNPYDNIYVGLKHLKWLMNKPDMNIWQALVAYNSGYARVKDGSPPNMSIEYANRTFNRWNKMRGYKY